MVDRARREPEREELATRDLPVLAAGELRDPPVDSTLTPYSVVKVELAKHASDGGDDRVPAQHPFVTILRTVVVARPRSGDTVGAVKRVIAALVARD